MNSQALKDNLLKAAGLLLLFAVLWGATAEFYNVAYGTGAAFGGFSLKWGAAYLAFAAFCIICALLAALGLWQPARLRSAAGWLIGVRSRLGLLRWLAAVVFLLLPVWFLQYSPWGVVFSSQYMRLLIWLLTVLVVAFLFSADRERAWTWPGLLAALLLSGFAFALAVPLAGVTNYPFALGWSEGNRLWDYSLLFGLSRYQFPAASPPSAYLEPGRELVGGLPFVWSNVSIAAERLWLAVLDIFPYLILGWLAFRPAAGSRNLAWILAGIWGFMFLGQGPIHAPLILAAILVALAWGQSLWLAVPLVLVSGYFAEVSRYTWIFAPAMWAVLLEFTSEAARNERMPARAWWRAISVGVAGLFGSLILPRVLNALHWNPITQSSAPGVAAGGVSVETVTSAATKQPLLWYRLFPNATYGSGILLGLLLAAGPLVIILVYLSIRHWKLHVLQKLAVLLPLIAFLAVGLVISTKIGGGGDLHNLDMFLIGLLFAAAVAWRQAGRQWITSIPPSGIWMRTILVLAIALPAFQPLMALRPISFAGDANWLVVLTDAARPRDLGSLPSDQAMQSDLTKLRNDIRNAQTHGEVLFIDQRQLLTFGYVKDVSLVSDYEKKRLMDEALSGDRSYFEPFYRDLAAHRFSLIISDPLRTPIKDSDYGFGEENNAWVTWVARPVLCYYQELDTLTNVKVELLVPGEDNPDCTSSLP